MLFAFFANCENLSEKKRKNVKKKKSKVFNDVQKMFTGLRSLAETMHTGDMKGDDDEAIKAIDSIKKSITNVNGVIEQAKYLLERSNKSSNTVQVIVLKTTELIDNAQKEYSKIYDIIMQMKYYILYGGMKQDSSRINVWLKEAQGYLDTIKGNCVYIEKRYNRGNIEYE